ncbi:MAG TPA: glycosyltransferase family 2 protein, partial [Vicinamibacteria bacterium]|nr:glycosyltransferase family 2 protein [Vicinamibacteria bacterium]
MPPDPAVSVVMVTWNGLRHLQRSVPAVLAQSLPGGAPAATLELIVVDNASADGSVPYLEALAAGDPRVRLLRNTRNEGFAGPNNRAFACARAPLVAT